MFHAVRSWWHSGRGKITVRLFVFEFAVVMVGVLAAQGLQNWVAHRNAVSTMEEARSRSLRQFSDSLAYAQAWQAAYPCLDERMKTIMRNAADGSVDARSIERPSLPTFIQQDLDSQSDLLMRQKYGNVTAGLHKSMRGDLEFANGAIEAIIQSWGRMSLGDPELGTPSAQDRPIVRAAAADISAQLVGLRFALTHFMQVAKNLGIKPYSDDRFRPVRTCDEIWQKRAISVPT